MTSKSFRDQNKIDKHLLDALTRAYTARALLFHNGVVASGIDLLIAEIDALDDSQLKWDLATLGISSTAFRRVEESGGKHPQVFAHPAILEERPHLVAYYRNLATISQKGIGQLLFSTGRFESKRAKRMHPAEAGRLCCVLNKIISGVIDSLSSYDVRISRKAILAEIGSQLQGTWANLVGQGAARTVESILSEYIKVNDLGHKENSGHFKLSNGWSIVFGSEPDIAFFDDKGVKRIAVEIKGSLDVAGAQTRYGEAKKSFAKQLAENPRCHTIYLASCFTGSVISQIKADDQVRDWLNLTSILSDKKEREAFLRLLFHIVNTPTR